MTRKALLVAVGDYRGFAQKLTAPAEELKRWQKMLAGAPYRFNVITPLPDGRASRDRVIAELELLLQDAQPDDQLLFVFMGHGTVAKGPRSSETEQSLIVYPGTQGLQSGVLCESDIEGIFRRKRPPKNTDITFVLDTCFAANYGDEALFRNPKTVADGLVPLFVPPWVSISDTTLRTFGTFAEKQTSEYERPIILAASGKREAAYEIGDNGQRRLLFTKRLLAWLERKHDTFDGIIKNINPLHPVHKQTATLGGNKVRSSEKFPGQASRQTGATAAEVTPKRAVSATAPLDSATSATTTAETTTTSFVDVHVLGLGCFINARPETVLWQARVVFPYDAGEWVQGDDRHFACLEIATRDIIKLEGRAADRVYTRRGIEYARWLLDAHTISIQTGDVNVPFHRSDEFEKHVPVMTQLCPEVRPRNPRKECLAGTPFPGLFAAFLDIPSGSVDIGPLNDVLVSYERPLTGEVTRPAEYAPISVKVNIPVITDTVDVVLRPYPNEQIEEVKVTIRSGSAILAANAREVDISGDGEGNAIPPEQFRLYYKLSAFDPGPDAPLPVVQGVPRDDCTVTDWP